MNGTVTQIDAGTDWIVPNTDASSEFECRVTNVVWDAGTPGFAAQGAADDVWVDLSTDRTWLVLDTDQGGANKWVNFTLEIRKNGGSVLASNTYYLRASWLL